MASTTNQRAQRESLLQDGVSAALAALYAIEAGELFAALPEGVHEQTRHNHGVLLIHMVEEHLTRIQQQVDALSVIDNSAED